MSCSNNEANETLRSDAIKHILERNPNAFESKFKQVRGQECHGTCGDGAWPRAPEWIVCWWVWKVPGVALVRCTR